MPWNSTILKTDENLLTKWSGDKNNRTILDMTLLEHDLFCRLYNYVFKF